MTVEGSITAWMHSLRTSNDPDAARQLWERYFKRLVALARREVGKQPDCGAYDEEDVALSAFDVLCRGMSQGKFDEVNNRNDLWRLLVVITLRKARDRARAELAIKRRGNGRASNGHDEFTADDIDRFLSREPDPHSSAAMAEECRLLLHALRDPDLERLALMRLDGHTNTEIARQLGCTRQTVQRRLRLIRKIWEAA